ncbi:hypothetical protein JD79_04248 [Geodermatophilus normandii]|uniref:Uncharacterized protein n=1 Tax=Geodermatophilus normandii TaxID=1137989 RepID=A0A317QPZ7_9ACTN|nr:hypothetical protein [Geodermatophilus normandii]PWW25054.1 hypothetical protein JD79_04248 [Geodermatophilus normandii]
MVVIGAAGVLDTLLEEHATTRSSDHLAELLLDWAVPIAVTWGLIAFSGACPDRVGSRARDDVPDHAAHA